MKFSGLDRIYLYLTIFFLSLMTCQVSFASEQRASFERDQLLIKSAGNEHTFDVEIAITDDQRARGLMYRRKMPAQHGMLFLFDTNQVVTMWMKNTFIPLDILFIDKNGLIMHMAKSTVPESLAHISSKVPVISVLELNAGTADRLNIQLGDQIDYRFFGRQP